jgi:hypothetical protein
MLPPHRPDRLWGQASFVSDGYRGIFPWNKAAEGESDHLRPPSGNVKNAWSCPLCLHGVQLDC